MQANWGDRGIRRRHGDGEGPATLASDVTSALPDLKPWNQAGWIFLDGDCVAIARQDDEVEEPDRQARILGD